MSNKSMIRPSLSTDQWMAIRTNLEDESRPIMINPSLADTDEIQEGGEQILRLRTLTEGFNPTPALNQIQDGNATVEEELDGGFSIRIISTTRDGLCELPRMDS